MMGLAYILALLINLSCAPAPAASKPVHAATVASDPARVKQIFEASCLRCHGPTKFNVLDIEDMKTKGLLQGGKDAKLWKRIADDSMPLGGPPLSFEQKEEVLAWLEDGYPPFEGVEPPPADIIDYGDEVTCAARDISAFPLHQSRDFKYLTFARYYNEGGLSNLNRAVEAATLLLNAVSLSTHIEKLHPVECKGVKNALFRIQLEEFNLRNKDWDRIVVDGKYPYFIFYFDKEDFGFFEDQLFQKTDCVKHGECQTIPMLRGDWFVTRVSAAPLYYDVLFKGGNVHDVASFEKFIGVDTFEQLFKTYEARRAIFKRSGVTNYNRMVDSYELDFWVGGIKYPSRYWKSFDTLGDKAQEKRNLFAFPFGPFYSFWSSLFPSDLKDRAFEHDATEHIVQAPNGSLFFFLADGKGKRINEALTEVAYHKTNAHPYIGSKPGAIVNGTSCFACHTAINDFHDEGKNYIVASTDFSNAQVDAAKLLFYKNQAEITGHVKAANDVWAAAVKTMKVSEVHPVDSKEPIFATARQYSDDIGVCELGAELGYDCGEMKTRLLHAPKLALLLGLGETLNGKVSRLNIEHLFADIAKELNIGKQLLFVGHVEPPPPVCKFTLKNTTAYSQKIDKLGFGAGTEYLNFWLQPGETKSYTHDAQVKATSCLTYTNGWCIWHRDVILEKCSSYGIVRRNDGRSYFQKTSALELQAEKEK